MPDKSKEALIISISFTPAFSVTPARAGAHIFQPFIDSCFRGNDIIQKFPNNLARAETGNYLYTNRHALLASFMAVAIIIAIALPANIAWAGNNENTAPKPNIILVLLDDMGWSDIGAYGGEIDTPNIDSLAHQGIRFTQFYNTSKCFPSRASLLTGQYSQRVGMTTEKSVLSNSSVTLAEMLRSTGYRTLMSGKHHGTDNPFNRGFDRYYGLRAGASNHFNPGPPRPGEATPAQKRPGQRTWCFDAQCFQPYTPPDRDFYTTDAYTDKAIEFLTEYGKEPQPFFLYLSYQAPHDPLHAWPEDIAKYCDRYGVGYQLIAAARFKKQQDLGLLDHSYPRSEPTHRPWQSLSVEEKKDEAQRMAVYAAMIDRVDQNIGRLLATLKKTGKLENTLILIASDNGSSAESIEIGDGLIGAIDRWTSLRGDWANVSNTPFRYFKNHSYEGGINTPLIAYWPAGIGKHSRVSEFTGHFVDFMPTFVELSGADYPKSFNGHRISPHDGISLLPVLQGEQTARPSPLYWAWWHGRALRDGHWKMVSSTDPRINGSGRWELYDMRTDKTETNNLAQQHPDVVKHLDRLYQDWRASLPMKTQYSPY